MFSATLARHPGSTQRAGFRWRGRIGFRALGTQWGAHRACLVGCSPMPALSGGRSAATIAGRSDRRRLVGARGQPPRTAMLITTPNSTSGPRTKVLSRSRSDAPAHHMSGLIGPRSRRQSWCSGSVSSSPPSDRRRRVALFGSGRLGRETRRSTSRHSSPQLGGASRPPDGWDAPRCEHGEHEGASFPSLRRG